jgi:hypothetical protein|nr:MAG TPA: hypothetical protein [Caudoviricetes sp.]
MEFMDVRLNNGKVLTGEKIGELVTEIINKFSEAELSYDEAKIVLDAVENNMGEYSIFQKNL